jgi:hypothetical protein
MSDDSRHANYRISSLGFLIVLIVASVFFMFSVFSEQSVCVFIPEPYDLMNDFDGWIPHEREREGVWDSGVDVPLNSEGYPRVVPFKVGLQEYVVKTVLYDDEKVLKDGSYKLSFKGKGKIKLGFDAEEKVYSQEGEYSVLVLGSGRGVYLEIVESDIVEPISDIHFFMPVEKELRNCVNVSEESADDYKGDYVVVSEAGLRGDEDYIEHYETSWEDKFVTGLITFFVILAVIYILK